jgi:hypothetical protein
VEIGKNMQRFEKKSFWFGEFRERRANFQPPLYFRYYPAERFPGCKLAFLYY